jgi:nucleotide-binding universal stress UspA family protein
MSVVETPAPLTSASLPAAADYFEETERHEREQALRAVERAADKLRESEKWSRLEISTDILSGSPKHVIVEEAEKWDADLIVVGSHDYRSRERMLLGSVSQAVAMHAECSVEIVRRKR